MAAVAVEGTAIDPKLLQQAAIMFARRIEQVQGGKPPTASLSGS
ncbi:hypothetical protein [Thermoactinospora rubra]|nr:hypothetical protein [Thermoactinospora rubra]